MTRIPQTLAVLALIAVIASPLSAADEKKKEKKPAQANRSPVARLVAKLDLTEEQQKKVEELGKKYGEQLAAARKGLAEVITPEQRQARAEAMKQAKADGKKGKELQEAVKAAVNLTDEQKKAIEKSQAQTKEVLGKVRAELKEILTEEQIAAAGLNRGEKKAKAEKKPGEKKKKAKEAS